VSGNYNSPRPGHARMPSEVLAEWRTAREATARSPASIGRPPL